MERNPLQMNSGKLTARYRDAPPITCSASSTCAILYMGFVLYESPCICFVIQFLYSLFLLPVTCFCQWLCPEWSAMKNSGNITQNTTQHLYSYLANRRRIPLFRDLELGCCSPAENCTVYCDQSTRTIVWRPRLLKQPVAVGGPHKERTLPHAEGSPKMFWVLHCYKSTCRFFLSAYCLWQSCCAQQKQSPLFLTVPLAAQQR
jgi:hypothetical protein